MDKLTCPHCGTPVIKKNFRGVTMFECPNPECLACISFGGKKMVSPGVYEAKDPVTNFTRRSGQKGVKLC